MADLPSSIVKINDLEVTGDGPVSEALLVKVGSTINGLDDEQVSQDTRLDALEVATATAVSAVSTSTATTISVTLTAPSGKVMINLFPAGGTSTGQFGGTADTFQFKRGATVLATFPGYAVQTLSFTDLSAGTGANTYTIVRTTGTTSFIVRCKLAAIEIR